MIRLDTLMAEDQLILESAGANVGLFWWYKDHLITFMDPVENLEPDSLGFVHPRYDHDGVWDKVVAKYPELRHREYYEVPRGRMVYNIKQKQFRLISSKAILAQRFLVFRIAREFHVPPQRMLLIHDEHYEM